MRFVALLCLAMSIGLAAAADGADAGGDVAEVDWMALRGSTVDGKTRVNVFRPSWDAFAADRNVPEARPAIGFSVSSDAGYMAWKNNCAFSPPLVAGEPVTVDAGAPGFGQITPYLEKSHPVDGLLEALADELAGDG